jgi:ferritin-like metal-binding protein YciE
MAKKETGLQELMADQLQELLDAEKQLVRALPKMAKGASSEELADAFRKHLEVTKQKVQRLENIFESMGLKARSKRCRGMKGIVEEGREILDEAMEPGVLDTALATAGRKVEHYEMAGYEAARALAMHLGLREAASLLEATLQEETAFDRTLAQLSRQLLKQAATGSEHREESGKLGASRRSSRKKPRAAGGVTSTSL